MHSYGWHSIYFMPHQSALKGSAQINLYDWLNQVLQWALGSIEILLNQHCPIWYGYKGKHLKCLERLTYIKCHLPIHRFATCCVLYIASYLPSFKQIYHPNNMLQ